MTKKTKKPNKPKREPNTRSIAVGECARNAGSIAGRKSCFKLSPEEVKYWYTKAMKKEKK